MYNGWTNHETWVVNLWMGGDEGLYAEQQYIVEDTAPDLDGLDEYELNEAVEDWKVEVGIRLRDFIEDITPEPEGMFGDLISSALGNVDWNDIAESWVEDELTNREA